MIEGTLDRTIGSTLNGWAWDSARPHEPVVVDLYDHDDRTLLASVTADAPRMDLVRAGKGDGRHAFSLDLRTVTGKRRLTVAARVCRHDRAARAVAARGRARGLGGAGAAAPGPLLLGAVREAGAVERRRAALLPVLRPDGRRRPEDADARRDLELPGCDRDPPLDRGRRLPVLPRPVSRHRAGHPAPRGDAACRACTRPRRRRRRPPCPPARSTWRCCTTAPATSRARPAARPSSPPPCRSGRSSRSSSTASSAPRSRRCGSSSSRAARSWPARTSRTSRSRSTRRRRPTCGSRS